MPRDPRLEAILHHEIARRAPQAALATKAMFGGLAFLLDRHMVAAARAGRVMLRVGPEAATEALARPGVEPVIMRGRPMAGYVAVAEATLADPEHGPALLDAACRFTTALPPK